MNPGMGWTMHYYSNVPAAYGSHLAAGDTADWFPGLSTVYLRIPWSMVEPEEGRFNWAILDTPAPTRSSPGTGITPDSHRRSGRSCR